MQTLIIPSKSLHQTHWQLSMNLCLLLLLSVLCLTADVCAAKVCSLQDVVDHLNLTANRNRLTTVRPVRDWTVPTVVHLDIFIYAILSVQHEKSQTFTPYIWIMTYWKNDFIFWDPEDFCGIQQIIIPQHLLWKPDLIIYETMDKTEASESPYLVVKHNGEVLMDSNIKVVSTCAIDVLKFPFDTQKCNLTFSSAVHTDKEIQLVPVSNSSRATKNSQEIMQTQGEWEFLNVSVHTKTLDIAELGSWDLVVYTITIRRVPLLYVLTFIIPILFFLTLDLASFFMSDTRGDKLCFKVTVLLAMSVLLLILTDTLPSKAKKTPLIAVYVIVVFAFMLLSVLETILVVYLMERASTQQARRLGRGVSCRRAPSPEGLPNSDTVGKRTSVMSRSVCGEDGVRQLETLPMVNPPDPDTEEGAEGRCLSHFLRLILQELQTGRTQQNPALEHGRAWYQNTVVRPINTAFFLLYLLSISVFLLCLFLDWVYW
ncbi:5-hydroxytryptamine receptor 3A-like isoform X1 [Alosa sapidissima]|uniref:5-hydroxytryptamine receptor 3A-like isoform X1 n=1 Tax=Alosa sapidissima TaxID=34773 RepID=UPI001C097209|nr:5-hydroxytryptamine receptor 3A-like isoform X1 [Alosa sapidissima]